MSTSLENQNDHYSSFQEEQQHSIQEDNQKSSVEDLHVKKGNTSQAVLSINEKVLNKDKSSQQDELMEALAKVEDQLKICIRSQNFVEAEDLKNKLKELRLEVVLRKSKEMDLRHTEEMDKLVEVQNTELQQFNEIWEKKVTEYKQEAQMAEQDMIKKHEIDLSTLEQDLRISLPLFVRTSPKIVNIRKMVETLAKQNEFVQAEKLKAQLSMLEDEELRKGEEQKEKKLMFILMQLATKQKNELAGLQKRISTGFLELLKTKDLEYQKLLFKLQNIRKSLETTHQLELSKFEMAFRNYIPGEKLQFKARKRILSNIPNARKGSRDSNALNTSLFEARNVSPVPTAEARKRSVTPVKRGFHIRGYQGNTPNNKYNNLIPINHGRFLSNQKERNAQSFIKS